MLLASEAKALLARGRGKTGFAHPALHLVNAEDRREEVMASARSRPSVEDPYWFRLFRSALLVPVLVPVDDAISVCPNHLRCVSMRRRMRFYVVKMRVIVTSCVSMRLHHS